jgi:hypothetical protein
MVGTEVDESERVRCDRNAAHAAAAPTTTTVHLRLRFTIPSH